MTQGFFFRRWTTKAPDVAVSGGPSEQGRLSPEMGDNRENGYFTILPGGTDRYQETDLKDAVSDLSPEYGSTFTII